jgi:hypothetical protein
MLFSEEPATWMILWTWSGIVISLWWDPARQLARFDCSENTCKLTFFRLHHIKIKAVYFRSGARRNEPPIICCGDEAICEKRVGAMLTLSIAMVSKRQSWPEADRDGISIHKPSEPGGAGLPIEYWKASRGFDR